MRQLGIFYCSTVVLYLLLLWIPFIIAASSKSGGQIIETNNDISKSINHIIHENHRLLQRRNATDGNSLSAVSVYKHLLVTIAANRTVFITNASESTLKTKTARLNNLTPERTLTQFKVLNDSIIFVGYEKSCWICELVEGNCCKLLNVNKPSIPEAVLTSDGSLMIHVDSNDYGRSTGIFKFSAHFLNEACVNKPIQYVPDQADDQVHSITSGFNRQGYTYFVGTVKRTDLGLAQFMLSCVDRCAVNTIRISRICDQDETEELLSRIDIPLKCSNLTGNSNFLYKNGVYNANTDTLITAVEEDSGSTTICSFNMQEVFDRFNSIWNRCQENENEDKTTCQLDGYAIFTHFPITEKRSCSKYGFDRQNYTNCNLHEYSGIDSRNGWLEDFCPFNGTVFTHLMTRGKNLWIQQAHADKALLAYVAADSSINRVNSPDFFWTKKININNHLQIAVDVESRLLFHIDGQKVKRMNISCKFLYDTCDTLQHVGWTDPLECQWCQLGESGFAFSNISEKCSGTEHFMQCSIIKNIDNVSIGSGSYLSDMDMLTVPGNEKTNASFQYKSNRTKTRTMRAILGIACGTVFTALICLIVWFFYRYSKKHPFGWQTGIEVGLNTPYKLSYESNVYGKSNDYELNSNYRTLFLEIDPKLQIRYDKLQLKEKIGEGNFGVVYKGIYKGSEEPVEVACKTINTFDDPNHYKAVAEFLQEGLIMASLNHPHILRLIGISLTPNILPVIVSDYLPNGNLLQYISDPSNTLTYGKLLHFGIEIASGMEYIHRMNYIHRDLAARNCMLDSWFIIKISDFGLTRQVSGTGAYQVRNESRKIPFRWLPPESLNKGEFTKEGDVWAFGVVLWEMATRGCVPYGAYTDIKSTMDYLAAGSRLEKPRGCPTILYQGMMMRCWDADPGKRPSFAMLIDLLIDAQKVFEKGVEIGTKSS